jgi:serine protease Do
MRKLLLTLFLFPFVFLPISAATNDWSAVVKKVEKALVYIEMDGSGCSGFVVDTVRKYVQTAAHCDAEKMWVDRVAATVISKDSKKDLMILELKNMDPALTALTLASSDPEIGQEVMSVGYGYALERPFFRKSMVSDNAVMIPESGIGGPFIGVDSGFIGGQSGGPVVDINGDVVAIVQRASDKLGIGVGASVIRERMGRFWAQK